ncbi:DUF4406 domain-containing protein [Serratia liquefaciens]|uniref:DUF4406 domain-containing protein n=1 Tax=Serratia liquefaciens TaxID=614 RepID=UPI003905DA8F
MKIYIAGPMSGIEKFNRPAFHFEALRLSAEGHTILNPATLPDGLSEREYMDIGCAMLRCADGIFLLSGWQSSKGARAEHALAEKLELEIIHQENAA